MTMKILGTQSASKKQATASAERSEYEKLKKERMCSTTGLSKEQEARYQELDAKYGDKPANIWNEYAKPNAKPDSQLKPQSNAKPTGASILNRALNRAFNR